MRVNKGGRTYPEFRGKVVSFIRESLEDYGTLVVVEFTDQTALTWTVRPKVVLEPELMNWKAGNGKTLRCYPAITTR
ncbi:MAG: hypothetical protein JWQ87_1807 [Candidatus Sulfotelmatobacter sp.]|nr:hypothetical protein [Candidatus Sulfotelmatobacter sp.]